MNIEIQDEFSPSTLQPFTQSTALVQFSSMSDTIVNEFFVETPNENLSTSDILNNGTFNDVDTSHSNDYIFDQANIRIIFITLYTIVFCSCFFGNLMVILVVTLHWRMRSITNFCLANLAFADLCVGIFCVYQNLITYMMESWIFGEFMCKMYHFINSLSTTASILILVVICIERYLAIIHPMRCKQMLTLTRLRVTIVGVWILSALISCPRFYYFNTMSMPFPDGKVEILCLPNRLKYDSKTVDMISMVLLFLVPLLVISILYFRIGVSLWKSSNASMPSAASSAESSSSSCRDTAQNHIHNPNSTTLNRESGNKRSFFPELNCIRCKNESRKRQRRSSGSFYGADKLGYKAVNLSAMNGMGNGSSGMGTETGGSRNTNGLIISCNGNSALHPINSASTLQSANGCQSVSHQRNGNSTPKVQCCGCSSKTVGRENESAPVSPYLKRDSTPVSSPPPAMTINSTDPIVLVKFEKKSSLRKCKRNQCTILMRSAVSAAALNEESNNEGIAGDKGDSMSLSSKNYSQSFNAGRNTPGSSMIASTGALERYGSSHCTLCGTQTRGGPSAMVGFCHRCEKNQVDGLTNSDLDAHPVNGVGLGAVSASNADRGCDKNLDCSSHFFAKDSIQGAHHHGTCPNGHQCASPSTTYIHFKGTTTGGGGGTSTTKGPKRMRVIRSSKYGKGALQCRRRIIKMLIVIVFAFAMCHLPFHARKIWQYWGKSYEAGSVFSSLFTPITFLIMYAQSGINPILYAFMSRKFRNSFADLLCCNMRRSLKISRNFSVRSTNAIQLSQAA